MPRRIAIVEDDAAIRANTADALKKHGYEDRHAEGDDQDHEALRHAPRIRRRQELAQSHGAPSTRFPTNLVTRRPRGKVMRPVRGRAAHLAAHHRAHQPIG